jgi:hypothetical protein
MKTTQQIIEEEKQLIESNYPAWVKMTTLGLMVKIRSLENQIRSSEDSKTQLGLLARQNTLTAALTAMALAVDTEDATLLAKLRSYR